MNFKLMLNRGLMRVKAKSPELCLAGGLLLMIGGAIVAVKKSSNNADILDEHDNVLASIDMALEEGNCSEKEHKKAVVNCYKDTALAFTKNYILPFAMEATGTALILTSYGIMKKRNVLLMGAYTALEAYHKEVMNRVDELEDNDMKEYIKTGLKNETIDITEVDEKGKTHHKKETVKTPTSIVDNPYTKFYGEGYGYGTGDPEHDFYFLITAQNMFNDRLRTKGVVFLNEVYDTLGFEPTANGAVTGWIYNGDGDNIISFGIGDVFDDQGHQPGTCVDEAAVRFINGYEKVILLNFNVDGVIIDKI